MVDPRIEYWYKVIDLVIEHVGTVETLSKEPVGDSVLRVLEEALKNNTDQRLPSVLENQAKSWEDTVDYIYDNVPELMSDLDKNLNPHSDSIFEALGVLVKAYKQQQELTEQENLKVAQEYWISRFMGLGYEVTFNHHTKKWVITSVVTYDLHYTADNEEELEILYELLDNLQEFQ